MWKAIPANDLSLIQVELKRPSRKPTWNSAGTCRKVANAQAELPEGASPSIVKDDFGNVTECFCLDGRRTF